MTSTNVQAVNINALPVDEAEAIRQAEAEAASFYRNITDEENERALISDAHTVCRIMWHNRFDAEARVSEYLEANETVFTDEEKATLVAVAKNINPAIGNTRVVTQALRFLTATAQLNRTMRQGYHFTDFPMTELIKRYTAK